MKLFVTTFFIVASLFAQTEQKRLAFDVISIKPSKSSDTNLRLRGLGDAGGRFSASNVDLRFLIGAAYGDPNLFPLASDNAEITGLPGWASSARYDVEAQPQAGSNPTAKQTQEMLQIMLEDRFQLKIRVERKDRPIYALVVDDGGAKMTPYAVPTPGAAPTPPPPAPKGGRLFRLMKANMETVAGFLTTQAGRKVVNKTGLTGFYEVNLTYAPDLPPGADVDPTIPSLFTAIREQLGLRLVAETAPVDAFVVESVQRPSEN